MTSVEAFQPTEIWTPKAEDFQYDEAILKAREDINAQNPGQLLPDLISRIEHTPSGSAYALLNGSNPQEYSSTEALVLFDSFSVGPSGNRLLKAEFVRLAAKHAGVTDQEGKYKPVIFIASPGPGSNLKLTKEEREEVKNGDLGPAARELLKAVSEKEIGDVALMGFSQGAAISLAGARKGYRANLDIRTVVTGDNPNVEDRDFLPFLQDFGAAGTAAMHASVADSGVNMQPHALQIEGLRLYKGMIKPINWTLLSGLRRNKFERDMQEILDEGVVERVVHGYSGDGKMEKPEVVEPQLARLHDRDINGILTSVKIAGTNHSMENDLALLSKLYLHALT